MAELVVGLKPNAANGFKRGGFLEVRNRQAHCRVGVTRASIPTGLVHAQSAAMSQSLRLQENLPV
jgi:hypothetical protein